MMPPNNLVKAVFYFGYAILFAFAALKITHTSIQYDKEVAFEGFIAIAAFIVMALIEIYKSKNITLNEKIMWTIGFLFFNLITGIIYFFFARKRVIRIYKFRSPFGLK